MSGRQKSQIELESVQNAKVHTGTKSGARVEKYPNQQEVRRLFDYDHDGGRLIRRIGRAAGRVILTPTVVLNHNNLCKVDLLVWVYFYGNLPPNGVTHINGDKNDSRIENLTPWVSKSRRKIYGKATKEYRCWRLIRSRCYDVNNHNYQNYGGRGLIVCDRWLNDFEAFLEDMGNAPTPWHSIDRIDNNIGYCKENCRWATAKDQANNRRNNTLIEFNGKIQTMSQWANEVGLKVGTICDRIKLGWPVEKLFKPEIRGRKRVSYKGESISIKSLAEIVGLPVRELYRGIEMGLTMEEIIERRLKNENA